MAYLTPEDYFARNQAAARQNPTPTVRRPTMDEFRANNRRVYGWDGTASDADRYFDAKGKRDIWLRAVLPTVAFATGGAALGALGGGAAAGAGAGASAGSAAGGGAAAGAGYSSPGVFSGLFGGGGAAAGGSAAGGGGAAAGGGMTFGNLLSLGQLGAGLYSNISANRQNQRFATDQNAIREREFAAQQELIREQNALARQQYEASEGQRAQEFAMLQEDRARRIRLEDEREARRAPYRQASQAALLRMRDLLRLGR